MATVAATPPGKKRRIGHEMRIALTAIIAGAPAVLVALIVLWRGGYSLIILWTLTFLILLFWLGLAASIKARIALPLQTISNVLASLREGDFSLRARDTGCDDALSGVVSEVNALSATLQKQRLGAVEAAALLQNVMQEIDVAVFAFDGGDILKLVNRAGERLLAAPEEKLIGKSARELGLDSCLDGENIRLIDASFPGGTGQWEMRRSKFRQEGMPHRLLVLSDLSKTLREEERQAWKRLIRVLGHELNNSLAPIKSIAGSLSSLLHRSPLPGDWEEDTRRGLAVIQNRSESLSRFMEGYARLAQLPPPQLEPVNVSAWIRRVSCLETRMEVKIIADPDLTIRADEDQLDQLLINLLRNAVDAALGTGGAVQIGWAHSSSVLEVWIDDEGPGISNASNLFVPFFTTKPNGSGIGLALSRQIAEAHHGSLSLDNRRDARGCRALVRLPLRQIETPPDGSMLRTD
ncbi:MAG: PAS domain-containing sensor histidine kinase [Acidobacteria bacterium]|nr:PAS domain-containing sensor histidine kinase [Acidobacteriota bacterium]